MTDNRKIVVGFGSKIYDTTATIAEGSPLTTLDLLEALNQEIRKENRQRSTDDQLNEIHKLTKDLHIDALYDVIGRVIEKFHGQIDVIELEGGSVHNCFASAKAVLGDAADQVIFHHIPGSYGYTNALAIGGFKIMATLRPEREVVLTEADDNLLAHCDAVMFPASSLKGGRNENGERQGFAKISEAILSRVPKSAKVLMTAHGGATKDIEFLLLADAITGTVDESVIDPHVHAQLHAKDGFVQFVTDGPNGLDIKSGAFDKHFATLPIDTKDTMGAGNGPEGVLLLHLLGLVGDKNASREQNLHHLGNLANAAGRTAVTYVGAALKKIHHSAIWKTFAALKALPENRLRSEVTAPGHRPTDHGPAL